MDIVRRPSNQETEYRGHNEGNKTRNDLKIKRNNNETDDHYSLANECNSSRALDKMSVNQNSRTGNSHNNTRANGHRNSDNPDNDNQSQILSNKLKNDAENISNFDSNIYKRNTKNSNDNRSKTNSSVRFPSHHKGGRPSPTTRPRPWWSNWYSWLSYFAIAWFWATVIAALYCGTVFVLPELYGKSTPGESKENNIDGETYFGLVQLQRALAWIMFIEMVVNWACVVCVNSTFRLHDHIR